jgi:uronate dehydrogenase
VRRIVYASSHHAVGFYRRARVIDQNVVPRPDGIYGVSKVFGEAVGRLFADKHGLSVACLRIGAFRDTPTDRRLMYVWLSPRDAVHLVQCCIDAPDYHFITVYGVSDNARTKYRNADLDFLGYKPQDKSEDYAVEIMREPDTEDPISRQFHGGMYTPMGFDGDAARIE